MLTSSSGADFANLLSATQLVPCLLALLIARAPKYHGPTLCLQVARYNTRAFLQHFPDPENSVTPHVCVGLHIQKRMKGSTESWQDTDFSALTAHQRRMVLQQRASNDEERQLQDPFPLVAVGAPVRILHNVDKARGLVNAALASVVSCNGTQSRITSIQLHLEATDTVETIHRLPWVTKTHGDWCIRWRAFPLQLAYAMTIHAAQGTSI